MKDIRVLTSAAAALVLWLQPAVLDAQALRDSTLIPVVVMMPPAAVSQGSEILITRGAKDGYRIIIPRSLATPENLRSAIGTVTQLLDRDGDGVRDDRAFTVEPGQSFTLGDTPGAERIIEALLSGGRNGRGGGPPSVTIYLPDARTRAATRGTPPGGP